MALVIIMLEEFAIKEFDKVNQNNADFDVNAKKWLPCRFDENAKLLEIQQNNLC